MSAAALEVLDSCSGRYTRGLLMERFSSCGEDEDTVSMALTSLHRLMRRCGVGPADNIKSEFLKQYYRREGKEHVQTWKEFSDFDADRREERRRMSRYSELSRTRQFNGNGAISSPFERRL